MSLITQSDIKNLRLRENVRMFKVWYYTIPSIWNSFWFSFSLGCPWPSWCFRHIVGILQLWCHCLASNDNTNSISKKTIVFSCLAIRFRFIISCIHFTLQCTYFEHPWCWCWCCNSGIINSICNPPVVQTWFARLLNWWLIDPWSMMSRFQKWFDSWLWLWFWLNFHHRQFKSIQ